MKLHTLLNIKHKRIFRAGKMSFFLSLEFIAPDFKVLVSCGNVSPIRVRTERRSGKCLQLLLMRNSSVEYL